MNRGIIEETIKFNECNDLSVIVNRSIIEETIKFIRRTGRFEKH